MRAKLTEELIQQMAALKGDVLSNKDICRAVGIHEATLYRWLSKPSGRLHRALGESLKRQKLTTSGRCSPPSARRLPRRTASGRQPRGSWSASTPTSMHRQPATRASAPRRPRRSCSAWPWARRSPMSTRASRRTRTAEPMVSAADLCIPRFHDVLGDVMAHGHTHYWLHGGRGSTKSGFISLCIVLLVVAFPYANACVVRRFSNTLRDSVY